MAQVNSVMYVSWRSVDLFGDAGMGPTFMKTPVRTMLDMLGCPYGAHNVGQAPSISLCDKKSANILVGGVSQARTAAIRRL